MSSTSHSRNITTTPPVASSSYPPSRRIAGVVAVAMTCILSACGGSVGTDAKPAPDPRSRSSTSLGVFTQSDVEAAIATCGAPHGDVDRYDTVDGLVARLAGPWIYCGAEDVPSLEDFDGGLRIGLEFTSDGYMYYLSLYPGEGVQRGRGLAGQASYEIEPPSDAAYNNASFQITAHTASGGIAPFYVHFETAPRRMMRGSGEGYFVPLVALGASDAAEH